MRQLSERQGLRWVRWALLPIAAAIVIAGVDGPKSEPSPAIQIFDQRTAPRLLSEWNLVLNDGASLTLNPATVPYDLNSELFSDYALKLRGIYVPPGEQISYRPDGTFEFPIGSAIVKTFYYPRVADAESAPIKVGLQTERPQGGSIDLALYRLIETRLLVLQPNGAWTGLPYVWDADQKDATLKIGGADIKLDLVGEAGTSDEFSYAVPSAQTCQQCHSTQTAGGAGILPIGPKARNLNKTYAYAAGVAENQLVHWDELGLLGGFPGIASAPVSPDWRDDLQSVEARAKAYLDINCGHCHSARGAAFQSGLSLDFEAVGAIGTSPVRWGVCKKPLAYGGPGLPYRYDIEPGEADNSLLLYRMNRATTADAMPPVGRKLVHTGAIALITDWLNQIKLSGCM